MTPKQTGYYTRASWNFARLSDALLIAFVRNVITLMTGNVNFTTPSPALTVVQTALDAFATSVQVALNGGRIAIATRNAARSELLSLLRQLASYVTGHCNNDIVVLLGSGFEAVRTPSPVTVPATPENVRLELTGISEELMLKFQRVYNAPNYSVETATSPEGPWEDRGVHSTSRVVLDGFTPGTVYWARVCANGAAGASGWSGPATARAI